MRGGKFYLVVGPMFSGKSTQLLNMKRKYEILGYRVLVITHAIDKRYDTESCICTHDKMMCDAIPVYDFAQNKTIWDMVSDYDLVLIDEGQFFQDLVPFIKHVLSLHKDVCVSALVANYKREPFPSVVPLYSYADKIIHQTALCRLCKSGKAPFTHRHNCESKDDIVVGESNIYESLCRSCYETNM